MIIFKRAASLLTAAVIAASGMFTGSASAADAPGFAESLAEISGLQQQAIRELETQEFSKSTATAKVLCVLFSDATLFIGETDQDSVATHVTMAHDSDAAKILEYEFKLFEEAVFEMTHGALQVECTTFWYDEPYEAHEPHALRRNLDYATILNGDVLFPLEYNPENYDFVFGFTGMQGVFGATTLTNMTNFEYAYCQIPEIARELELVKAKTPLSEMQKICWTGEVMIHEWMHEIDIKIAPWLDAELHPECHDYLVDANEDGTVPELVKTEEDGVFYLTNPQNGYKWKYEEGKYSGHIVDYYEAYLSGEIIDTKHGGRKVGICPALWKAVVRGNDLGYYTVRNAKNGHYLFDNTYTIGLGTNMFPHTPTGPLTSNVIWDLRMDTTLYMQALEAQVYLGEENAVYESGGINFVNYQNMKPDIMQAELPGEYSTYSLLKSVSCEPRVSGLNNLTYSFQLLPNENGDFVMHPILEGLENKTVAEPLMSAFIVNEMPDNDLTAWKIEPLRTAEENYIIRYQKNGDVLTGTTEDSLMQPFLFGTATGMQTMVLKRNAQGLYTIQTADEELTLTVDSEIPQEGDAVRFAKTSKDSSRQLWILSCEKDNSYQISHAVRKDLLLEWDAEAGTLTLQKDSNNSKQTFEIGMPQEAAGFSSPYIQIANDLKKYLSASGSADSGLTLSDDTYTWKITELGGGYVKITALDGTGSHVLTLKETINADGNKLVLDEDCFSTDPARAELTQSWKIVRQENGTYQIIPKSSFTKGLKTDGKNPFKISLSSVPESFVIQEIPLSTEGLNQLRDVLIAEISMNELDESYDMNRDGKINAVDLTLYKRWLMNAA